MLLLGTICALVATASAGYASSSSGGYAGAGVPIGPFASPYDFQNNFQHLFAQQLAYQAALQNSINANIAAIRNQALYGANYGYGSYPAYGGSSAGSGAYASGGAYSGNSGVTGSYGGVRPGGSSYGGTVGGPNYAAAGGSVGSGHQHQYAGVYPPNPARPNLDSRFSDDSSPGVTYSRGPGGFVGVSSFSSSSDINGVKNRESGTSVNNNGKVTTYYTRN
ncbi:hypothetical protein PVAND_004736 [Polypedilum vanderplanki]|uniref:Uncharacterized protein n=1 Tax=Polypedilum vanderplanki TaxID=319348 RepID=A0A9J6BY28_POLVA|nr:hypothetical protein PVAND_004736 [Polypedilum vanderplanki]